MARYIDADKLMNEIDELKKSPWYNNDYDGHKCARHEAVNIVADLCIKSQATADLINRQKAEIERLQRENHILSINADTAFQDGLNEAQELYAEHVNGKIKTEAVKEFLKLLIEKHSGKISIADIIDFAVDYLKGENNG